MEDLFSSKGIFLYSCSVYWIIKLLQKLILSQSSIWILQYPKSQRSTQTLNSIKFEISGIHKCINWDLSQIIILFF